MQATFDVIVIGSGSGLEVSSAAAERGLRVAVIDDGPFGGTCHNRGCIPSKMLIHVADVAETIRTADRFGLKATFDGLDWQHIIHRTFDEIDAEAESIERANREAPNISVWRGEARFIGPKRLAVGGDEITGGQIVIAAGTRPDVPKIDGLDTVTYYTSDDVMRLPEQPRRLVVVGGGYVAAELAHFFGSLGTEVTIVTRGDRLLTDEDDELSAAFTKIAQRRFRILTDAEPNRVRRDGDGLVLESNGGNAVAADVLLIATGRVSNADRLAVEATGVETDANGYVKTDEFLQTAVPGIWALGDIVGRFELKHSANLEAAHVAHNMFAPADERVAVDYRAMPHAIFAAPQIGSVGMTERQAREADAAFVASRTRYDDAAWGDAVDDRDGFVKVLIRLDGGLLGVHVLGTDAATLVQEAVNVMRHRLPVDVITQSIYIHPAAPEVIQRAIGRAAADAAHAAHEHGHAHEHADGE